MKRSAVGGLLRRQRALQEHGVHPGAAGAQRAWGGNYLPDFGPRADGTLAPTTTAFGGEMAAWMKHSGESLDGVEPLARLETATLP